MTKGPKRYYEGVKRDSAKLLTYTLKLVGQDRLRAKVVLWATLERLKKEKTDA